MGWHPPLPGDKVTVRIKHPGRRVELLRGTVKRVRMGLRPSSRMAQVFVEVEGRGTFRVPGHRVRRAKKLP